MGSNGLAGQPQFAPGQNADSYGGPNGNTYNSLNPGPGAGGKKNSGPPPNYKGAAQQMQAASQQSIGQQTQANRPNQYTGFGTETWTQNPDGTWTQNTSLNPTLGGALGNLQNTAAANSANGAATMGADRNAAIGSNYAQAASRLDPQWNQRAEQMQSQLVNQGLDPSSEAYKNAMTSFNQGRNDAYSSAMANAIGLGNQTEGMDLQAQMAPYQQMGALQGFQNGLPGFNAAGAWTPGNYLGAYEAAGNYNLTNAQQQQQMAADVMQGAGQIGSAAVASDARIKTDIQRLPIEAAPGIPLATFKYKHAPEKGHQLGVIAQDVEEVAPEHVTTGPDGIKRVNYAAIMGRGVK